MTVIGVRRAYRRYNERYWNGELPASVSINFAKLKRCSGLTKGNGEIFLDPAQHFDDRALRHSLLHEMLHIASLDHPAHNLAFWEEVERILRQGAPIELLSGYEKRLRRILQGFPRPLDFCFCKKALKKLDARMK
jgi:predicted metal-dependent hydrolase